MTDQKPYVRPERIFTAPEPCEFPFNLLAKYPLPDGAEFKGLQIDRIYVHYHRGKVVEQQFSPDMRSFGRVWLRQRLGHLPANVNDKDELQGESLYFVGKTHIDLKAREMAGFASDVLFRLGYDPRSGLLSGDVEVEHAPDPSQDAGGISPVSHVLIGYAIRYIPAQG